MTRFRIEPLGDHAFLIGLASGTTASPSSPSSSRTSIGPDPRTNARVHRLAARLREKAPAWLRDLVPAYASLGVFVDPARVDTDIAHDWLRSRLDAADITDRTGIADIADDDHATRRDAVVVPVLYGGAHGADLDEAARMLDMTPETLVARHCAGDYTVAMLGFAPGFPYLLGLDPALALPRLATPRTRVPAGSVAIGGAQTGIYPRDSPGGWRLLGRTPLRLFDPARSPPSLLQPGDRVRFRAIGADEFAALERDA